jgi:hypothetical protein
MMTLQDFPGGADARRNGDNWAKTRTRAVVVLGVDTFVSTPSFNGIAGAQMRLMKQWLD